MENNINLDQGTVARDLETKEKVTKNLEVQETTIHAIPPEILEIFISFVPVSERKNIALISKNFYVLTYNVFKNENKFLIKATESYINFLVSCLNKLNANNLENVDYAFKIKALESIIENIKSTNGKKLSKIDELFKFFESLKNTVLDAINDQKKLKNEDFNFILEEFEKLDDPILNFYNLILLLKKNNEIKDLFIRGDKRYLIAIKLAELGHVDLAIKIFNSNKDLSIETVHEVPAIQAISKALLSKHKIEEAVNFPTSHKNMTDYDRYDLQLDLVIELVQMRCFDKASKLFKEIPSAETIFKKINVDVEIVQCFMLKNLIASQLLGQRDNEAFIMKTSEH
jgi:hypothetical protein